MGSARGGTLLTFLLVALLAALCAPPPAPRTLVTMGAQHLGATGHALQVRDRRQLTRTSLPPATLTLSRG
jgi:hypothetical protein